LADILNQNLANVFRAPENKDTSFQGYFALSSKIEQPHLFNSSIKGSLEFYFFTMTLFRVNINALGVKVGFDFELPDYSFINQLKTYYNSERYNLLISLVQNTNNDVIFNSLASLIGTELGSNKANDPFFPTNGYNLSLVLELGVANSMNKVNDPGLELALKTQFPDAGINTSEVAYFYKSQLSFSKYFPLALNNSSTIGVKFKTGYLHAFSGNQELIPPNKTFAAGGSNSVRGWRARQLVPIDTVTYSGQIIPGSVMGGSFLLEGSFEFRKKISESLGYALFSDYGNTWNGLDLFRFNKLALAIGFGFRYYTSIIPFRLDFGFKLYDPASGKWIFKSTPFKTFELHFGIGEAF
jgi:outer membrane protein insertion porin family